MSLFALAARWRALALPEAPLLALLAPRPPQVVVLGRRGVGRSTVVAAAREARPELAWREGPALDDRGPAAPVDDADHLLWVTDALQPATQGEREALARLGSTAPVSLLVARADLLDNDDLPALLARLRRLAASVPATLLGAATHGVLEAGWGALCVAPGPGAHAAWREAVAGAEASLRVARAALPSARAQQAADEGRAWALEAIAEAEQVASQPGAAQRAAFTLAWNTRLARAGVPAVWRPPESARAARALGPLALRDLALEASELAADDAATLAELQALGALLRELTPLRA
jgi:hypothetical protein